MRKIAEYCEHCEEEVKIAPIMFIAQKCPKCGHPIKACSMCDCDICDCSKCEQKWSQKED